MSGTRGTAAASPAYLWYVVFALTVASTLSFVDRQILNLMIGPVKRDLGGLSDTEISLVMGLAFAGFYNLVTYPMARLADARNRRNLMVFGVAFWSAMTALCGLASQYWQLFVARMGVGTGEATLGPAANSMLADYFDRERLPLALGVVSAAPFIGTGLANTVGGPLIDYLERTPALSLPLLGELYSWQVVFVLVGLPGLGIAALLLTVREPARRDTLAGAQGTASGGVPYRQVWAFVAERWRYFALHFLGYLGLSTQGFALLAWIVEFFVRQHGWTKTQIGLVYGVIALVIGVLGSVSAGWIAGRMLARGRPDATLRLVLWGTLCLGPLAVLLTLLESAWLAVALLCPVTFFMAMPPGMAMAALQSVAPNELRGQSIAFYLIAVNFLSYTFAPSLPALMNDYVFRDEGALGYSLSILAALNYTLAAVSLGLCLKPFRRALEQARAWEQPG